MNKHYTKDYLSQFTEEDINNLYNGHIFNFQTDVEQLTKDVEYLIRTSGFDNIKSVTSNMKYKPSDRLSGAEQIIEISINQCGGITITKISDSLECIIHSKFLTLNMNAIDEKNPIFVFIETYVSILKNRDLIDKIIKKITEFYEDDKIRREKMREIEEEISDRNK